MPNPYRMMVDVQVTHRQATQAHIKPGFQESYATLEEAQATLRRKFDPSRPRTNRRVEGNAIVELHPKTGEEMSRAYYWVEGPDGKRVEI